jgi:Zn-dependent M28 family amino/carboxypeptidase
MMTIKNITEHHPEGIGSNVIGILEGNDPVLKNEALIVGGHLDGLGRNPELMPGANNNASAVSAILGIAEALAKSGLRLKRSVIFILFGGAEQGLKGSEFYVANPVIPNNRSKAFFNLDTVGRGESIHAAGGGNYPVLWESLERNNRKYLHRPLTSGFDPNLGRPSGDAAHFVLAGVPAVSLCATGGEKLPYVTDHTSGDTLEIITPDIMADIARLVLLVIAEMANETNR